MHARYTEHMCGHHQVEKYVYEAFPYDLESFWWKFSPTSKQTVERAVKLLKMNKAAGHDGIVSEHIIHSHPALMVHL